MDNYYGIPERIWDSLKHLLPTEGSPKGGRPHGDTRMFLNAIHWMLRTGAPWRALPDRFGSWKTIYSRFRRWQLRGYFIAIFALLATQADMEMVMIDGSYVHAHKHSAGARHASGSNQAIGKSRGGLTSKIHAVVDALGNLISFVLTGGQRSDISQAYEMLRVYSRATVLADKGYASHRLIRQVEQQGCQAVIPSKRNSLSPRIIDMHVYKERHLVENFFCKIKEYRKIATRYDKLATVYSACVYFAASLIWLR